MTTRWLTTRAELAALAPAWDAALADSGSDNPFLLSEFLLTWAESFAPGGDLRILAGFKGDTLVAGLPLFRSHRRHAGRRWPALRIVGLGFANLTEPFFVVPAPEFARGCASALRALEGWNYLSLPLARAPWWETIDGLPCRAVTHGTTARIRVDRDAAAYRLLLRPKMQANLRRCLRNAEAFGHASLRRETDPVILADLIEFQLRHNGPGRYPPERELGAPRATWADFIRHLLPRLAADGHLDAMALRLGGEVAAVGFGFRYGRGYKSMLTGFDPRFRAAGPGFLFFHHLLEWCWREGKPYLEMYADGRDPEKRRWCREFTPLHHVRIFPDSFAGRLLYYGTRSVAR